MTSVKGSDGPASLPLYLEIQRDIESGIAEGRLQPGDRLPTELELTRHYGCSRLTVSKAMAALVNSGFVLRRRRSGSFVARPRIVEPLLSVADVRSEVLSLDRSYTFRISDRSTTVVTPQYEGAHLGFAPGTPILTLEMVHFADRLPFVLETRIISLRALPEAEHQSFETVAPGTWLMDRIRWTETEHSLRAVSVDPDTARALKVSLDSPCVAIARRSWRDADLVTFARLVYPGERHRFVVRFKPPAG